MEEVLPHQSATEQLRNLYRQVDSEDFHDCIAALHRSEVVSFDGVWGSSCALLVSTLAQQGFQALVLCPDQKQADNLGDDLETFFSDSVSRFPVCQIGTNLSPTVDYEFGERLRLVKEIIADRQPGIVVSCPQALIQGIPDANDIANETRLLRTGDQLDIEAFIEWLLNNRFHRTTGVELPGEFSVRGGIIDLFATDWLNPIRIELFDDEIESIRYFEVSTQKSIENIQEFEISVTSTSAFYPNSLLDILSDETLIILVENEQIESNVKQFITRAAAPENLLSYDQLKAHTQKRPTALFHQLAAGHFAHQCRFDWEPLEKFHGDMDDIRVTLDNIANDCNVTVVVRVDGEIPRVQEILSKTKLAARGLMNYSVGCVHAGFRWPSRKQLVVGSDQLFQRGQLRRTRRSRKLGKAIDSFIDLNEGDLIVHLAHGIGRFRGLKILDKDGQKTEHLDLEFDGRTRIYVPATKIDLVQKYVGGTKTKPTLAKIGGKSWLRQKQAAESAVTDLAAQMLEIQAERAARPGISFAADTTWQAEFEHSFPYRETTDQISAIGDIKEDMQTARPMDRLLCGDVGFGKTEVAMRAAFKAVENGYQVAVLVPTTILAEQHFRSFRERMSEFPLDIAKLSRFCTPAQQRETIAGLKAGRVDIVIGTHRLASRDVAFHNLGLVVIDEEQRFGVEVKERLKTIRSEVDVLTMSATPIPRTLHMSLVGVRDISNLETPPEDRLAVETRVTRWDDELIRRSVMRELNRGGQIYFVHNRVNDIHIIKSKLSHIVPDASICVGHGQMPEGELSKVMTDFIDGKFDLLLATTIIESGLDIPNANTMIINEADRYGLADLHQLRGRVGRYKNRAYCYLLIDEHKHINPVAAKRLHAIQQYSEIGAGFAIAMRDLEIRGAGNLLGTEQSGHIAAVGYELYCNMLENAVRAARQMPKKISIHVDVDLPLQAFLPDDYIPDRRAKIDLYRRLTRLNQFEQISEIKNEMLDRFGPLPKEVKRLLKLAVVKLEAAVWQINTIFMDDKYLGFRYDNRMRIEQLSTAHKGRLRVVDDQTAYITLKSAENNPDRLLALVKSILQPKS